MNLPANAIDFLDVFRGFLSWDKERKIALPMIHCYCFSKERNPNADVIKRIEKVIGTSLSEIDCINSTGSSNDGDDHRELSVHEVRDVAPNKHMLCVSFRLPRKTAYTERPHCKRTEFTE